MSNTKVMSPYRQTDRTDGQDGQTDEHIIFEAHYTMGPSGNDNDIKTLMTHSVTHISHIIHFVIGAEGLAFVFGVTWWQVVADLDLH